MEAQINNIIHIDEGIIAELELTNEQFYEQWMLDNIAKIPYKKGLWLDIGAHTGNHTVYFSNKCKCDEVWAFEPTLSTFNVLLENIENNKGCKVECFNYAVGSEVAYVSIKEFHNTSGENRIEKGNGNVLMVKLDNIKEAISLIKIDVEGFELEVLKGAKKVIKRDLPELFIETFSEPETILKLLPKQYKIIERYNNAPTYHFSAR